MTLVSQIEFKDNEMSAEKESVTANAANDV